MRNAAKIKHRPHSSKRAMGRTPSKKSESTRKRILDAAAGIFASKGYSLTHLRDIAGSAGMHLAALYYYYDSKEELAADVLRQVPIQSAQALRSTIRSLPASAGDRARIEAAIDAYLQSILHQDDYIRAYPRLFSQVSPATREDVLSITRQDSRLWHELLGDAAKNGVIRKDLDRKFVRMLLLGSMNWAAEWFRPGIQPANKLAHVLKIMLFEGIALRPEAHDRH